MKTLSFSLIAAVLLPACVASTPTTEEAAGPRGPIGKADLVGSCEPDACGGKAAEGNCWCDDLCSDYGDCCGDKEAVCDAPCQPDDCGDEPVFVHCADGVSIAAPDQCVTLEDGACGWTATCALPEPECTPADCGEQPIFIHCADGLSIAAPDVCTTLEDGACGWTATCALPDEACDCGENPGWVECEDDNLLGVAECTQYDDGTCEWTAAC